MLQGRLILLFILFMPLMSLANAQINIVAQRDLKSSNMVIDKTNQILEDIHADILKLKKKYELLEKYGEGNLKLSTDQLLGEIFYVMSSKNLEVVVYFEQIRCNDQPSCQSPPTHEFLDWDEVYLKDVQLYVFYMVGSPHIELKNEIFDIIKKKINLI